MMNSSYLIFCNELEENAVFVREIIIPHVKSSLYKKDKEIESLRQHLHDAAMALATIASLSGKNDEIYSSLSSIAKIKKFANKCSNAAFIQLPLDQD